MSGKKICLVSDHHLCTNPRAWKEAKSLAANGYDVTIVTVFTSAAAKQRDEELLATLPPNISYVAAVSFIEGDISFAKKLAYKATGKLARMAKRYLGVDSPYLLNSTPKAIFSKAIEINADLYICHIDCSLFVGKRLIEEGRRVAYDFEDWYSHDYLVPTKPVTMMKNLEQFALRHGAYVTCPSHAMADAIADEYGVRRPHVIYNGFPQEQLYDSAVEDNSIVWFSQTIGPGRGLEKFITVLQDVQSPVSLHLIGDISDAYREKLAAMFAGSARHQLVISPQVRHKDLHRLLCGHAIGLALEETHPPSRYTTVTNKILQYLQAGLKVFATATKGQREIAADFEGVVWTVPPDDTAAWAAALNQIISTRKIERTEIVSRFNKKYSWEAQEGKLLELVAGALEK